MAKLPLHSLFVGALVLLNWTPARAAAAVDYDQVDALFSRHCLDCHATKDPEGKLILESHEWVMKGGESGAVVVPGQSGDSLLIRALEGRWEKEGKVKLMPPGKRKKLEASEIQQIRQWIDGGALAPKNPRARRLVTPDIQPRTPPARSIQALAFSPSQQLIAVGRYGEAELLVAETRARRNVLSGHHGKVNAVAFSGDGSLLVSAAGQPGVGGEVKIWKVSDGTLVRTIEGHRDALYSVAVSPDSRTLATGSYDQEIKLWDLASGQEQRTLHGHNGAVYDLAFRPDGKVLASASGDRTVKLWEVETGRRLDTLSQSTKEVHTVAWSGSGGRLFAGGVDNRIRIWRISPTAAETTNPLLESRFAHDGTLLNLVLSPDGRTLASSAEDRLIKLWDSSTLAERLALPNQPDLAPALAFINDGRQLSVGRLDGSLEVYDTTSGKVEPLPKPELIRIEPRGIQRGIAVKARLIGKQLMGLTRLSSNHPKLSGELMPAERASEVWIDLRTSGDLPRGTYTLQVMGASGESNPVPVIVDDFPQIQEVSNGEINHLQDTPASLWGALDKPGESDRVEFPAQAGQQLLLELSAKSLGSKLSGHLDLVNPDGMLVASEGLFDGGDPLLVYRVPTTGRYRAVIRDEVLSGSPEHFYRLRVGAFPLVVASHPLSVTAGGERKVQLVGYNLPPDASALVKAETEGEAVVPVDTERFHVRGTQRVVVTDLATTAEVEPNDVPAQATPLSAPGVANGIIQPGSGQNLDQDYFSFASPKGRSWVIETDAARWGSPVDTRIEVLHADGRRVERVVLQAVRNTAVNFRSVEADATGMRLDHYEEMELNQFLYLNGEVMRLFRMPQGPDSEMMMYSLGGRRRTFFDTTPMAHALDEQGFIVEAHPPGAKWVKNGLPAFTLYYANDDDGERRGGRDSSLSFTAPEDGKYLVRVTDSTGRSGERFRYRLLVREPRPDFTLVLEGANPSVARGSAQSFTYRADRLDGFAGEIRLDITGIPPGFTVSTPLFIEAGHTSVSGTIAASEQAAKPDDTQSRQSQVTAQAEVDGRTVILAAAPLGVVTLQDSAPKLSVQLEAYVGQDTTNQLAGGATREVLIEPGQRVSAWLGVKRSGYDDTVNLEVANLPHGVIVDDLGLNAITFLKGETGRQIFLSAARWVKDLDRPCFAIASQAGRPASAPMLLKVRTPPRTASSRQP